MTGDGLRRIRSLSIACAVVLIGGLVSAVVVDRRQGPTDRDDAAPSTTSPPTSIPETPVDLLGAGHSIIGDELWIYGGLVAPPGTEVPISAPLPDEWVPNPWLIVYGADGSVLRWSDVQLPRSAQLADARGAVHIVADAGPLRLHRIDGDELEEVPLDVSTPDPDTAASQSRTIVAQHDNLVWIGESVGREERILAIDVTTGESTQVTPPTAPTGPTTPLHFLDPGFCTYDDWLYTIVGEGSPITRLDVTRRPVDHVHGDWELVGQIDVQQTTVVSSLRCIPERGELMINDDWTMSTTSGAVQQTSFSSPDVEGVLHIGLLDGAPVGLEDLYPANEVLRLEGTVWQPIGETTAHRYSLAVLDNRLVDISGARGQFPAEQAVVEVDLV